MEKFTMRLIDDNGKQASLATLNHLRWFGGLRKTFKEKIEIYHPIVSLWY